MIMTKTNSIEMLQLINSPILLLIKVTLKEEELYVDEPPRKSERRFFSTKKGVSEHDPIYPLFHFAMA